MDMNSETVRNPSIKASLEYAFAQARLLVDSGLSVTTACKRTGISRPSYYRLLGKSKAPASEQARGESSTPGDTRKSPNKTSVALDGSGSATPAA